MNNYISDRGQVACYLKWSHAATKGVIILPMMQEIKIEEQKQRMQLKSSYNIL